MPCTEPVPRQMSGCARCTRWRMSLIAFSTNVLSAVKSILSQGLSKLLDTLPFVGATYQVARHSM